jgi:Resolvase, N terminal domain
LDGSFLVIAGRAAEGDVIVVCKLDRFFRTLRDLVNTVADLGARGGGEAGNERPQLAKLLKVERI